jgi:xanthosine utilization system XapX-like protein
LAPLLWHSVGTIPALLQVPSPPCYYMALVPLFFRGIYLLISGFSIYCYSFSILTFEI